MSISEMTDREAERVDFIHKSGWAAAHREKLGQDASTRSYERLTLGAQSAIFMDAPAAAESAPCGADSSPHDRIMAGWNGRTRLAACRVDAFVGIAAHLRDLGLSAPKVFSFDVEKGFAILEDLGDGIYAEEIPKGVDEKELYLAATDVLVAIHKAGVPESVRAGAYDWPILKYDRLALTTGADLFPKWYPSYDPRVKIPGSLAADLDDEVGRICDYLEDLPDVFMMRDYHAENLFWLKDRQGLAKVGILDFQDAVSGPAAWDLAMFVQDARRDVSPAIQQAVVQRYSQLTGYDENKLIGDLALAGAINALRILGVFARLIWRDGKPKYGAFMEREWGHLEDCLVHPELKMLRSILAEAVQHRERLQA